ncbi:MAG: pyrimidine dimer DNA glycosylase/endonuclease V [Thermodesulfovibrionales bacterium]
MRLWSLHPEYLDTKGLVALWREGLLAKKVLEGRTKAYTNHPQLIRFKTYRYPLRLINAYLYYVYLEAKRRGYNFNRSKIQQSNLTKIVPVTTGQIRFEFLHLKKKLMKRDRGRFIYLSGFKKDSRLRLNPVFYKIDGPVEDWEKGGL